MVENVSRAPQLSRQDFQPPRFYEQGYLPTVTAAILQEQHIFSIIRNILNGSKLQVSPFDATCHIIGKSTGCSHCSIAYLTTQNAAKRSIENPHALQEKKACTH